MCWYFNQDCWEKSRLSRHDREKSRLSRHDQEKLRLSRHDREKSRLSRHDREKLRTLTLIILLLTLRSVNCFNFGISCLVFLI